MTTTPDSPAATSSPSRPVSPDALSVTGAETSTGKAKHTEHPTDEPDADANTAGPNTADEVHEQSPRQSEQASATAAAAGTPTASVGDWQAIFSPAHNAYYFYNAVTQETTWTNPLQQQQQPAASSSTSPPPEEEGQAQPTSSTASVYALQAAAAAQGIDPSLAYLDPSLAGPSTANPAFSYTAKFNARTGTFTRPDGRDPTHLSEYERAKRMSMAYFDVGEWEKDVEERDMEEQTEGKKRKRPTKKDLERFKEQKRLKKIAKTAWLRT